MAWLPLRLPDSTLFFEGVNFGVEDRREPAGWRRDRGSVSVRRTSGTRAKAEVCREVAASGIPGALTPLATPVRRATRLSEGRL
jgi:hypothetical protein